MRDTGEVSLSIYTMYGDTGYAVNLDFSLGEFEKTFDKVCEDPESVGPYNYDALHIKKISRKTLRSSLQELLHFQMLLFLSWESALRISAWIWVISTGISIPSS